MPVPRGRMNRPRAIFIRHVQINAVLEQHRRALRVSVERRYVHQRRAILSPLENARFELIREQLDYVRVSVLRG